MICTPKQTYDVNENVDFIEKRARMEDFMCTAATYRTKDFYFGRTLDYEFSYGEEIAVTPRNYPFHFQHTKDLEKHYAIIGMAHMAGDYPLYYDAVNEKVSAWQDLILSAMHIITRSRQAKKM